jgi:hypothetical protein
VCHVLLRIGQTVQLLCGTPAHIMCLSVCVIALGDFALQLGITTELIQLWGQSIDSERSKLKDEKFFSGENEQVQAEILSRLLVRMSSCS